jgi:hypothetical protein
MVVVTSHEQQLRPPPKLGEFVADEQNAQIGGILSFPKVVKWVPLGASQSVSHAPNHCHFLSIEKSC